jgi:hypothetical protein
MFMEVMQSPEAPLLAWQEERWLLKQQKQSSMICLSQVVILSQLLVLKCYSMLMLSFVKTDTSQLYYRQSLESAKEV